MRGGPWGRPDPLSMYLNVVQLAESFGVEEGVVANWVHNEGLPCVPDRGRWLFDRAQVVAWAAERGQAARAGFLAPGRERSRPGWRLEPMLRVGEVWRDIPTVELLALLEKIAARLPGMTPPVLQLLTQRLRAPNGISWAPIGGGLALPHLRASVTLGHGSGIFALVFLRDALSLGELSPDQVPVTRLCFFIAPSPRTHLELLGEFSAVLTRGRLRQLILDAAPDADIFSALAEAGNEGVNPTPRKVRP